MINVTSLILVVTIFVCWLPQNEAVLSTFEWIAASQDALSDPANPFMIKAIQNPVCDKMLDTRECACHSDASTKLTQWYFSTKCVTSCNQGLSMDADSLKYVEVYCTFSPINTLNTSMELIEWSAGCHCPENTRFAGTDLRIGPTTFGEMKNEYLRLKCDQPNAVIETSGLIFNYDVKGFESCILTPEICDPQANCVDDICICEDGFAGNGIECFHMCEIPIVNGVLRIVNADGMSVHPGDKIQEFEIVTVTCDSFDQPEFHATCSCSGFDNIQFCKESILIIGGNDGTNPIDSILVFYPEAPSQSYISDYHLSHSRSNHVSYRTEANEIIIIHGIGSNPVIEIEVFDPTCKHWLAISSVTSTIQSPTLAGVGDVLYVCGGYEADNDQALDDCKIYNVINQQWTSSPSLPADRFASCSFVIDNTIYIIGGNDGTTVADTVQRLDTSIPTPVWQDKASYPFAVSQCGAASYEGKGYVCGGASSLDVAVDLCYVYDPVSDTWNQIPTMNKKRKNFEIAEHDGILYAFFGEDLTTIEKYDIKGDQVWVIIDEMTQLGERSSYSIA